MSVSFPKTGIDVLLSQRGKNIKPGETVTFTLVKGASGFVQADPVDSKAPLETFPLIAKFPESVPKPDFMGTYQHSRLYQQDAPKAKDDSDEEDSLEQASKRKRWRRQPKTPQRQWVLQPETDFLETVVARKKHQPPQPQTTGYVGIPEHNPSHYAILSCHPDNGTTVTVATLQKPYSTTTFSQPRPGMTLSQAEQAITNQRAHMSRYMMHKSSKLLGKLSSADDDEDDDVMADVAFKHTKVSSKARKELLQDEEDIKVDASGVLGGTNDAEFGGHSQFARLKHSNSNANVVASAQKPSGAGNDGMAMSDDFYQRDVVAEYQDLDYDANEQFEDDDVDMGETEIHLSATTGFAEAETDEEDEVLPETSTGGVEGLATIAGFQQLLAKARGQTADPLEAEESDTGSRSASPKMVEPKKQARIAEPTVNDPLASLLTQAEKAKEEASKQEPPVKKQKVTGVELDKQGRRVLSLEAVQREIWLNHGSILVKRILKTFSVKAKDKERYNEFVRIAKTVSTFEKDELGNAILVLKQHYKKKMD